MGKESRTEHVVDTHEALAAPLLHIDNPGHYETTISDSEDNVKGSGSTSEESQRIASEKWEDSHPIEDISNGGGCYLTTACVGAMGLPNDCLELSVLRRFRDRILLPASSGREAVQEYYRIAPEIVHAVNGQQNASRVWSSLYNDIRQAVSLVLNKDFEGALKHYQQMTQTLKEKYLG